MLPIRQIMQEMAAEKLRLSLTILAVAWSTLCIAGLLAVGEGIRSGIVRTIQNGNGNLIHVSGGYATQTHGRFHEGQALSLSEQDSQVLAALPMVKRALPSAEWQELITFADKRSWMMPYAVKSEYQAMNKLRLLPGGRWFNPVDEAQQRKVVVLGYQLAVQLFNQQEGDWFSGGELEQDPVGQIAKIGAHEFTVIGVLAKNSGNIEQGSPIDYSGFTPFSTWQRFHPNQAISGINLEPRMGSDRQALAATVQQVLKRKYAASLEDQQIVMVQDHFLSQKKYAAVSAETTKLPWHYRVYHFSRGKFRHYQCDVCYREAGHTRHWRTHGRRCNPQYHSLPLFGSIFDHHGIGRNCRLRCDICDGSPTRRHSFTGQSDL